MEQTLPVVRFVSPDLAHDRSDLVLPALDLVPDPDLALLALDLVPDPDLALLALDQVLGLVPVLANLVPVHPDLGRRGLDHPDLGRAGPRIVRARIVRARLDCHTAV